MGFSAYYSPELKEIYIGIQDQEFLRKVLREAKDYAKHVVWLENFKDGEVLCEFVNDLESSIEQMKTDLEAKTVEAPKPDFPPCTPGLLEDE